VSHLRNLRQPKASACSVERVADGGGVPALAALGGGDAVGVESVRDRGQALAGVALAPDPLEHIGGDRRRSAEADALRAGAREPLPDALRDQPPLAHCECCDEVCERLPGWGGRLEGAVERDQRPALLVRGRDEGGELEQRLPGRDLRGGDQRPRLSGLADRRRLLDAGMLASCARAGGLLDPLEQLPAATPARGC
jgi:hypothetical protein